MTLKHNLTSLLAIVVLTGTLFLRFEVAAQPFVYQAVPYTLVDVLTGDEYTISGTITTSCNVCETGPGLEPTDIITDFNIEVSGPAGLVFDSTAGAFIVPGGPRNADQFSVSPSSIRILDAFEFLSFSNDLTPGQFEDIRWQRSSDGASSDIYFQNEPQLPARLVEFTILSEDPLVVATAVPEPCGVALSGLGCLGLLCRRLQRW